MATVEATDEDVVRIEDRRNGMTVTLTARRVLALYGWSEVVPEACRVMRLWAEVQAAAARRLAQEGLSEAAVTALLDQSAAAARDFAAGLADALHKETETRSPDTTAEGETC